MEPMSKARKVIFWHLVGLAIVLLLVATHLMAWNIDNDIWRYFMMGATFTSTAAVFAGLLGR